MCNGTVTPGNTTVSGSRRRGSWDIHPRYQPGREESSPWTSFGPGCGSSRRQRPWRPNKKTGARCDTGLPFVAEPTGFEPATFCVTGRYANRYTTAPRKYQSYPATPGAVNEVRFSGLTPPGCALPGRV